jgi:diguanylate cyclase (GGDEF)-like protein/PAS domain S-box-containing protein
MTVQAPRAGETHLRMSPEFSPSSETKALSGEQEEFWSSWIRLCFVVLAGEAAAALAYFVLTPKGPHRSGLILVSAMSVVVALATTLVVNHVARQSWRTRFSALWTVASGALLTACVILDGGIDSPLVYFVVLPVVGAALALSTRAVVGCGLAALAELVLVSSSDSAVHVSASRLALLYALVLGVIAVSIGSSVSRSRLRTKEGELIHDLAHLAETDPLTGVLNHGAFYQRLQREIDRALRHHQDLSLIVADVDFFKSYNDAHGHLAGDEALAGVAATLETHSRSSDTVARVGGDEFAVVLPHTTLASADQMAKRMSDSLEKVTVSMGISTLDLSEPTTMKMFRDADAALFLAKAGGRNQVNASPVPSIAIRRLADNNGAANGSEDDSLFSDRIRTAERATSEALSILDAFQAASPVGMCFIDRDYRILRINSVLAEAAGETVNGLLGRTVAEVTPDLWQLLEPLYSKVMTTGEPFEDTAVIRNTRDDAGPARYWSTTLYPVRLDGDIIGLGVISVDVTHQTESQAAQSSLMRNVVSAIAAIVEARDPYTAGHQERVAQIAAAIARELGCSVQTIEDIELAARVHDVGKVTIPSEILTRPGRLNDAEMNLVRMHAKAGFDILDRVHFPDPVSEMVLHHHERLDGSGYPHGLRGDAISLGARIIAVADVIEAASSHRPYRPANAVRHALDAIEQGAGTLYDPEVVSVCARLVREGGVSLDSLATL